MSKDTIVNFKTTKTYKEQIRKASFHAGFKNISEFLKDIVARNKYVKQQVSEPKK